MTLLNHTIGHDIGRAAGPTPLSRERTPSPFAVLGFAFAFVAAPLMVACSDLGTYCTAMGCSNGATTQVTIPLAVVDLDGLRLEVCRNDACAFANIHVINVGESKPSYQVSCSTVASSDAEGIQCDTFAGPSADQTSTTLNLTYGPEFANGDRFVVRVTDASAERVYIERSSTLNDFKLYQPNGPECDEGYACRQGTF